jgi:hypothetical protein
VVPDAQSASRTFLDAYRAAFETFEASRIADFFNYPFQITSEAGTVSVVTVPTREAWLPQLQRLVGAYRVIGVHTADVLALHIDDLSPGLAQATVHWGLVTAERAPIYDFTASYTVADLGAGMRIAAIAHNESPRLRAYLEAHKPG